MQPLRDDNHIVHETSIQPFSEKRPILNRVVVIGAIGAILIALLGLLGYVPGLQILGSIREGYIPMAPSTAISFIVLGSLLVTMFLRSLSSRTIVFFGTLAAIVSLFGVLEVAGYFTGIDLNFENALVPGAGYLGDIPIARMSPSTGAGFFFAGLAVIALLLQRSKTPGRETSLGNWGGSLGSLVLGISLVFSLAYFWGSPMLYGQGATIPMALSTAIAFLMLGAAIVGTSGEEAVPVRLFTSGWHSAKAIGERGRILLLTFIMVISCGIVMMIILVMLYRHNIDEHRNLLVTTVQSQARLIEAVAQYDSDMSITLSKTDPDYDAFTATLGQIIDAHERYQGFGKTGEFTLARREGNSMVFILRHRLESIERPEPVDFNSNLAEPMRRALRGLSGTIIDLDYRGETVLAAYEPVRVLNLGIVAKIDIEEIRSPFIRTGLSAVTIAFIVILAGTTLFFKISSPMIEKLEAYSLNLSLIHETIEDMLFQLDVEPNDVFRFATVNRAFLEKTGLTQNQIIGKTVEEVISEESLDMVLGNYRKAISEKKMVQWEETSTYPTGILTGIVTVSPSFDKQGECSYLIGSVHDITDRKRLEEQFHHSQRMEAVGRLAGGIAHDFNNVLTVISGNAQMGLNMLQEDTPLYERLTTVIKAADHAGDLTSKLLAFGRKQIIAPKVLDLNSVLVGMYPVLRRLITEEIDLTEEQGSYLGKILMDPGQLEQILVNLVVNASEAMPEGGNLTIETAMVELDEEYVRTHAHARQGHHVMLAVSDTGHGISDEDMEHIFEPFYTTKSTGSGLGLATVFGIVKQNKGSVEVYSEEGVGTSFKIYFPEVDTPADEYESQPVSAAMPEGTETILLVEDQKEVRKLAALVLKDLGYDVHDFADPRKTAEFCESFDGSIDLLLTDVVMPGESGKALGERLQKVQPSMQVLFMSGYTDNSIVKHGVLDEGVNFLPKPFTMHKLAQKVRSVLDGKEE